METFAQMFSRVTAAVAAGEMTPEDASVEMARWEQDAQRPPMPVDPENSALTRTGNFRR